MTDNPESIAIDESERVLVWSEPHWDASVHSYRFPDGREMIFFHLDVFYLSATVIKEMKRAWKVFRAANTMTLFTIQDEDSPANRRLVEMFGFKYLNDMPCTDGKTRNLYVHYGPTHGAQKQ